MEALVHSLVSGKSLWILVPIAVAALALLAKGADVLVEEAVNLSSRWGIPKALIGATIVSLGTTLPEAAVSVAAAIGGNSGLAMGNAVGSVITDCGLILGLAALIAPLPIERKTVNRQGWIQVGTGVLLVVAVFPFSSPSTVFSGGGLLSQGTGFVFLGLLVAYMYSTIRFSRKADGETLDFAETVHESGDSGFVAFLKLGAGIALVIVSSQLLIPTVEEIATRIGVPEAVIAATLVAFGTSLPELVTALSAVRKGHGELALGNVIGADILNVLFVAGASAAVTRGGLLVEPRFFILLFPGMLCLFLAFRMGVYVSKGTLGRGFGVVMISIYGAVMLGSYLI